MPLRSRRPVMLVTAFALTLGMLPVSVVRAQDAAVGEAMCRLWSPEEVAPIIGAEVEAGVATTVAVGLHTDFCFWSTTDAVPPAPYVSASWEVQSLAELMADNPDGHAAAVGTVSGWYVDGLDSLWLPLDQGLLAVGVSAAPGVDQEASAVMLGELALLRGASLPAPPAPPTPAPPTLAPTPYDPGPAGTLEDALCQLWSPDEVARVVGGDVQAAPDFGGCSWTPSDASGPWMQLTVSWWDMTFEDQVAISVDGHEVVVGSATGWYEDLTGSLYLPFSDGLLSIAVQSAYGEDEEQGAVTLGEIAQSRSLVLPAPPTEPPPTAAETAFCELWSIDEVERAIGARVKAVPGLDGCFWFSDDPDGPSGAASVSWDGWTLDDRMTTFSDGHEVVVGSVTGWWVDYFGLFVPAGDGVLFVSATTAPGFDEETAEVSLAELALSRVAALPAPPSPFPTDEPAPSYEPPPSRPPTETPTNDPGLEAMVPDTVGGWSLDAFTSAGERQFADAPPEALLSLTEALAEVGKTLADVSTLSAYPHELGAMMGALRIRGADAATVLPHILDHWFRGMSMTQAPGSMAGKAVTVMTPAAGGRPFYVYVHGDTAWYLSASEPVLSEILAALP